jgi:hypothetical protein
MSQNANPQSSLAIVRGGELGDHELVRHAIARSGDGSENRDTGIGSFTPVWFIDTWSGDFYGNIFIWVLFIPDTCSLDSRFRLAERIGSQLQELYPNRYISVKIFPNIPGTVSWKNG